MIHTYYIDKEPESSYRGTNPGLKNERTARMNIGGRYDIRCGL